MADAPHDHTDDQPATLDEQTPAVTSPAGRRVLWAGLAVIAILAVIAAAVLAPGGSDDEAADEPSIRTAITAHAAELSGLLPADALVRARCEPESGRVYACTVGTSNIAGVASGSRGDDTATLRVLLGEDDTLTKRLAGQQLPQAPRAGAEVATALAADDRGLLGLETRYGCGFGPGLTPDGDRNESSPGGFRCTATKGPTAGADAPTSRSVEFAADGSVRMDVVIGTAPGGPAQAGPGSAG